MNLLPLQLAWQSLVNHKGRAALTIVGIVIGIAAVIIVMSAGESIKGLVLGQVDSFGSDLIQVEIKVPSTGKNSSANAGAIAQGIQITTLKLSDAEAISRLSNVKNYYAGLTGQGVASYQEQNKVVNFFAVSPSFIDIDSSKIAAGRFFTPAEDKELARVIVLGAKVAKKLFGDNNPVGASIKLGRTKFQVVGVLAERGGGFGFDFDELAYLPVQTAQKIVMGVDHLMFITVEINDLAKADETADEINVLLRERHDITDPKQDDFAATTMAEARDMVNSIFGGITLLLVAIAAISLIVGGVGIMNIMYVSVTERTFEIGLRQAVGATPRQILWQFLWEAVVVTVFGGIIGIILGIAVALLVAFIAGQFGFAAWKFILPANSVLIAFGFCGLVGLAFGYWPAKIAASLNPIAALRHE